MIKIGDQVDTGNSVWGICVVTKFGKDFMGDYYTAKYIGGGTNHETYPLELNSEGSFLLKDAIPMKFSVGTIVTLRDGRSAEIIKNDGNLLGLIDQSDKLNYIALWADTGLQYKPETLLQDPNDIVS